MVEDQPRPRDDRRLLRDPYTWSIVAVPWLLLFVNPEWPYTTRGIDPWIYLNGFVDLPGQLAAFKQTYYMTRLPWLLSGYAAYLLLPPLLANAALKISLHTVASVGIYALARSAAGRAAAAAVTVALATWYWFLHAVRWDYVDGFMIAILTLTILALDRAVSGARRHLVLGIAGALFMVMLATNQVIVVFAPALAWFYLTRSRTKVSLSHAAAVVGGAALALAVFTAIGVAVGTETFFLRPALQIAAIILPAPNPWRRADLTWLQDAEWLYPPIAVFAIALYRIARYGLCRETQYAVLYVLCAAGMLAADVVATALLQHRFYASWLTPAAALAAAEAIAAARDSAPSRWWPAAASAVMLVTMSSPVAGLEWPRWIVWVLGITLIVAVAVSRYRWGALVVPLVVVAASNIASAPPAAEGKRLFEAVVGSLAHLNKLNPGRDVRFWYSQSDGPERFDFYRGVASANLWGYRLISEDFPSLRNPLSNADAPIAAGMRIAVLTTQDHALDAVRSTLAPLSLDVVVRDHTNLGVEPYAADLILVEVTGRPESGHILIDTKR